MLTTLNAYLIRREESVLAERRAFIEFNTFWNRFEPLLEQNTEVELADVHLSIKEGWVNAGVLNKGGHLDDATVAEMGQFDLSNDSWRWLRKRDT